VQLLAPSPPPARPIPYGLVSLWDMINYCSATSSAVLAALATQEEYARRKALHEPLGLLGKHEKEEASETLDLCSNAFAFLDSRLIEGRIDDFRLRMKREVFQWLDLAAESLALNDVIACELKQHHFYHYPKDKAELLLRVPQDWAATLKAFPSVKEDVEAAVDCYALGHSRASVYHSMMILESGLPALATRLKVKFNPNKATWAEITKGIRDKIIAERGALAAHPKGTAPPSRSAAKRKSAFLEACEEAVIEFRFFTTLWRNHVAHGRVHYDDNDAKKALDHVRNFMEVIVTKLKLQDRG